MQYLITAYDGKDSEALSRRMAARGAHIETGDRMKAAGELHFAAAILNDEGAMIGSMMVTEFSSRAELDSWLKVEPYVTGNVWETIDVQPCRVGPSFARKD